jgi:CRISPR-associated protein Cmr1
MKKPVFQAPEWRTPEELGMVEIVRTIEIVTPMFGGGVALHPDESKRFIKEPDRVTLLRPATVVGQVRFWWRALFGARMDSLASMQAAEAVLFGAASSPGQVSLRIEGGQELRAEPVALWDAKQSASGKWNPAVRPGNENLAYGAFALQAKAGLPSKQDSGALHRIKGAVRLVWHVPEHLPGLESCGLRATCPAQLRLAVDAWLLFGGVGGRTRRGFGALDSRTDVNLELALQAIRALDTPEGSRGLPGVPMLKATNITLGSERHEAPDKAHDACLRALRAFRQGSNLGRNPVNPDTKRPGRSLWPEADAIRWLQNRSDPQHSKPIHDPPVRRFPRALFGLPIVFHFQSNTDPRESQLVPRGRTRMASPLLLRPVPVGRGQWAAACILLSDPARAELQVELAEGGAARRAVEWRLSDDERAGMARVSRGLGFGAQKTAHNAFVKYFEQNT